jgi:hypothetical protein
MRGLNADSSNAANYPLTFVVQVFGHHPAVLFTDFLNIF